MKSFIHRLNTPACITSFDGVILDANHWFLKSFGAKSKAGMLKCNLSDLVVDTKKYKRYTDYLLSGKIIQNEKLFIKDFNEKPVTKITFASVLSFEKQQIFIQIFEIFLYNHSGNDLNESLLAEITELSQHLDTTGRQKLAEIVARYDNGVTQLELTSRLEYLKNRLGHVFPVLSMNEIDISAMLVEGFSILEISEYAGIAASNVRNAVFRICKKLQVNSLEELFSVLRSITVMENQS